MNTKEKLLSVFLGRSGGGNLYSFEFSKALKEHFDVKIMVPQNNSTLQEWEENFREIIVFKTYKNKIGFAINTILMMLFWRYRLRKIRKMEIKYLYFPMIQPWSIFLIKALPSAKIITTVHDPKYHIGTSFILKYLYNKVIKKSNKYILLSKTFQNDFIEEFKLKESDVVILPHGRFNKYNEYKTYTSDGIIEQDNFVFLFFGRITPYKGIDVLLSAFLLLHKEYSETVLRIVGSGDLSKYSIPKTDSIQVINRYIEDNEVSSFFNGNKIVTVLPYIEATQSGVIPIAWENKSLIICSNVGGLSEQVEYGKYALMIKPNDSVDLYNKMKSVITDNPSYDDIVNDSFEYIKKLDWNILAKNLLDFLNK